MQMRRGRQMDSDQRLLKMGLMHSYSQRDCRGKMLYVMAKNCHSCRGLFLGLTSRYRLRTLRLGENQLAPLQAYKIGEMFQAERCRLKKISCGISFRFYNDKLYIAIGKNYRGFYIVTIFNNI